MNKCIACGQETTFFICQDCCDDNGAIVDLIHKMQDKLQRRNCQISDLKHKIGELKYTLKGIAVCGQKETCKNKYIGIFGIK